MRRLVPIVFALLVLAGPDARACSICRCGDPLFSALGPNVFSARQWRVSLDEERFDKENAVRDEAGAIVGHEGEVEYRTTLSAAFSWNETFTLFARVPWSAKRITSDEGSNDAHGLSDPELLLHVRLWASPLTGLGRRTWVSLLAGIKTPWGENDARTNGERVEQHLQPGTGATDAIGGLAAVHILGLDDTLFASTQYRRTGTNEQGYRYGDSWLLNVGLEHRFGPHVSGVLELDGRDASQDVVDASGARDPDTGGRVLYLQPRLVLAPGGGRTLLRLAALIPIAHSLNGDQAEHAIYDVGLTFVF